MAGLTLSSTSVAATVTDSAVGGIAAGSDSRTELDKENEISSPSVLLYLFVNAHSEPNETTNSTCTKHNQHKFILPKAESESSLGAKAIVFHATWLNHEWNTSSCGSFNATRRYVSCVSVASNCAFCLLWHRPSGPSDGPGSVRFHRPQLLLSAVVWTVSVRQFGPCFAPYAPNRKNCARGDDR